MVSIQNNNIGNSIKPYQRAARLIEAIQKNGATQKEIAELLNISPSLLSKLKSKEYFPKNGEAFIEKLKALADQEVLSSKLKDLQYTKKKSNIKSILASQKSLERVIIIALITGLAILAYFLTNSITLNKKISANHNVLASIFIEEIEEDLEHLVNDLTLASPTKPQQRELNKISSRFNALKNILSQNQDHSANIDSIIGALFYLIDEDKRKEVMNVFPILENIKNTDHLSIEKSMALVIMGYAHHINKENIEKIQCYDSNAEKYFEAATSMGSYTFAPAHNGLAVHKALKAFHYLEKGEAINKSFQNLLDAEFHITKSSSIDGSLTSYYKAVNNINYIRIMLLSFHLDKKIKANDIIDHFNLQDIEEFFQYIHQGCREAENFAHGSPAAPFTTAEGYSVLGQYYKEKRNDPVTANKYFEISKSKLIEAVKNKIYGGKEKEEVQEILLKEKLLQAMLNSDPKNLKDILFHL